MARVSNIPWLPVCLFLAVSVALGCTGSSSNKAQEDPYPTPDISGVWLGYFGSPSMDSIFSIGIILEDEGTYISRFIADDRQYVSPVDESGISPFSVTEGTAIFSGDLAEYSWSGSGAAYSTFARSLYLIGSASERGVLGLGLPGGAFTYTDDGGSDETGFFGFIYNTTFNVSPNVRTLGGLWEIEDAWQQGNTLTLTITPDPAIANTMSGIITARDDLDNQFTGSIVIHYSPTPHNVYDVSLRMNDEINLDGLVTLVLELTTSGLMDVVIEKKTLAIGATSQDGAYSLGGFAIQR